MRTAFLVDGFNLYHSLKQASTDAGLNGKRTRWLDLASFCRSYLPQLGTSATLARIQYFSALATHLQSGSPDTVARHQRYIKCLEERGVEVVLGRFKPAKAWCSKCNRSVRRHEEKETDVAIAVHLLEGFVKNEWDAAVLVTGDTDIAPGVKAAQRLYPSKRIHFVFPYKRKNRELERLGSSTFKATLDAYKKHQLPNPFTLVDGSTIAKPQHW